MESEGVGGKVENPLALLAEEWPDGLHEAPPQQLEQGCCCCYGVQGEGYCCYYCSQAGLYRCPPVLRGGRSEGHF